MNLFTRIICLTLLITALVFLFFGISVHSQSNPEASDLTAEVERITGDKFRIEQKTPKGVKILAFKKIGTGMISAIDNGISRLAEISSDPKYGYTKMLKHADHTVYVARPDREYDASGKYSPDIAISAAQYADTRYDKGGYIFAAGMVVSFEPGAFLIAEHSEDLARVSRIVRFEGEHIVLYHNDRKKYRQTADHSRGGGHPILTP